jgi:hypothetical protein
MAPSSSTTLEDMAHVIENLGWIRSVRNEIKINISKKRVQKHY